MGVVNGDFDALAGGICSCCDGDQGCFTCIKGFCYPEIAAGEVAAAAGGSAAGCCFLNLCCDPCIGAWIQACNLKDLRKKHGMKDACMRDCCCHIWCGGCAYSQE